MIAPVAATAVNFSVVKDRLLCAPLVLDEKSELCFGVFHSYEQHQGSELKEKAAGRARPYVRSDSLTFAISRAFKLCSTQNPLVAHIELHNQIAVLYCSVVALPVKNDYAYIHEMSRFVNIKWTLGKYPNLALLRQAVPSA